MALDIQVDLSKFRADMAQTSRALARGREDGLDRAAEVVYGAKQKQIGKTYARKIPQSSTGRPLWQRKGNWTGGQQIERPKANERHIVTRGPASKYEGRLANLPTGAEGINRTNKASEEAHRITVPQVVAVIENAIGNALRALS